MKGLSRLAALPGREIRGMIGGVTGVEAGG